MRPRSRPGLAIAWTVMALACGGGPGSRPDLGRFDVLPVTDLAPEIPEIAEADGVGPDTGRRDDGRFDAERPDASPDDVRPDAGAPELAVDDAVPDETALDDVAVDGGGDLGPEAVGLPDPVEVFDPGASLDGGEVPDGTADLPADRIDAGADAGCGADEDCLAVLGSLGPCEIAKCVAGNCVKGAAGNATPCDDGDPCSEGESCSDSLCQGRPVDCGDGNACTLDVCVPGSGCLRTAIEGPCDDGSQCTRGDTCQAGTCTGQRLACDDGNPCTVDGCDPATGCTHGKMSEGTCDDGSVCTTGDRCADGVCTGAAIECDDHEVCTFDSCDPVSGCRREPTAGAPCDDGDACTVEDRCDPGGVCDGSAVPCDDGNPCTDDRCLGGTCEHPANTVPCDDLNACTDADACRDGSCAGVPRVCDEPPANACEDGDRMRAYAHPGVCTVAGECSYRFQVVDCEFGCVDGLCAGDPCAGVDCLEPPGPCYQAPGTCSRGACSFLPDDGKACDDGNLCTGDDTCGTGLCAGIQRLCNQPPGNTCLDDRTLEVRSIQGTCDVATGTCRYGVTATPCSGGCANGVCLESLVLRQAELDPGGRVRLEAGLLTGACVLPGWYEGATGRDARFAFTAGFEP